MEWKSISELRPAQMDYSGLHYSYEYAKKNKNLEDICVGMGYMDGGYKSVSVLEAIEIKRDKEKGIVYRVVGRENSDASHKEFDTRFGRYISDDHREFGGELVTPSGRKIGGNFTNVFDLGDRVYAIDSHAHLTIAGFNLYCFDNGENAICIYSSGTLESMLKKDDIIESMHFCAMDIVGEAAYILINGHVENNQNKGHWYESRLLKVEDGRVEEVVRFTGKIQSYVKNIIVEGNDLYISCDKVLVVVDLETNKAKYYTCISVEDEKDLEMTNQ